MIGATTEMYRFVEELSGSVREPIHLYLLGGGSMMYAGL